MPRRKYPTKKKTTTPEGLREYRKLQQRDIRARMRKKRMETRKELLAKLDAIREFQQLSEKERKILADAMAVQLERFEKALNAVMHEWAVNLEEGIQRIREERDHYLKVLLSQYARVSDVKRATLLKFREEVKAKAKETT